MNINVNDITITSLETIMAVDIVTGNYKFTMDELHNATIAQTQDKQPIVGKQGRKLNSLKRNKAVTVSGTNGFVSGGLLELQTGGKFENKATTVMWTDYLTVNANASATNYTPVGSQGAEIDSLHIRNKDGTLAEALVQTSSDTPSAGQFFFDSTDNSLTFATADAIPDGTEIVAFYKRRIQASVLNNMSDNYSEKCALYIDAFGEDSCNNVYRIQFYIPRADFDGNFDLSMGENQTVHAFSAESLSGSCGAAGTYWTYTIFNSEAQDVV